MTDDEPCPCGSGEAYGACCGAYLDRGQLPDTAEALMRSRYCAYVGKRAHYLLETWHRSTRPAQLNLDEGPQARWLGLKILQTEGGGPADAEGRVEFVARYKVSGKAGQMQEASRFVRENGRWFYVDGNVAGAG